MILSSMLWAALLCTSVGDHAPLHVSHQALQDAGGREIILRGMNFPGNAKVPPFRPVAQAADLDLLPALGINVIRLLFTWEAYEPQPGVYDQSYIDYYAQVARWAWERGIYTVVDFHQDAMSRVLLHGCGEGFPAWVIPSGITHHTPDNRERCSKWFAMMWLDYELWRAWDALYTDVNGIRAAYLGMVARAAQDLLTVPGIVGYDIINEPRGDEVTQLAPFYEDATAAIRRADPQAVIFVEPHLRVDVGLGTALPKPSFDNFVYAPHFYDGATTLLNAYLGYSLRQPLESMKSKAREWDVPLFLGEFGSPPSTHNALGYMRHVYDLLDGFRASGAQWSYTPGWTNATKDGWNQEDLSIIDDKGNLRANFAARPYAQKVAGNLVTMQVVRTSRTSSSLLLVWDDNQPEQYTEIYFPLYRGGWKLQADASIQCVGEATSIRCRASGHDRKQLVIIGRPAN